MKRRGLFAVALGALTLAVLASTASASNYVDHPTIHEGEARRHALKALHLYRPGWRYRTSGYVDCEHGRINRYIWVCRVGWSGPGHCRRGRLRIVNDYREDSFTYFSVKETYRRC